MMHKLDKLLEKIESDSNKRLKSEEVFAKYIKASKKLDSETKDLGKIIDKLNEAQLSNLILK